MSTILATSEVPMADIVRVSVDAATPIAPEPRAVSADRGGWPLLLVPTGICLFMFVVAAWW